MKIGTGIALTGISPGGGGRPSLDLNLLAALDPRITFTRASSGTHFDSTGRLVTDGNNVARFDYDPAVAAGVTGGELVTNGDFSNGTTGWTLVGAAVSGGQLVVGASVGSAFATSTTATFSLGKRYRITYTVVSLVGDSISAVIGGVVGTVRPTTAGTYTEDFMCTATGSFALRDRGAGITSAVIDNISVQEVTFTPRGLLIEEQRTNLLLHSRDMTQAAWSKTDVTAARTRVGIDGVANSACLMTEGSAGTANTIQLATVTAGSTVTSSIVFKRGNTDWIRYQIGDGVSDAGRVWFNLNTGAKGTTATVGAATNVSGTITSLGGGWYRCAVTVTPNGSYTSAQTRIQSANADNSSTLVSGATYIVDCAQLEVGAFATSPIVTGAATATRAADSASMTGTNFSSWFNATQGTFVAEFRRFGFDNTAGSVVVCQADDGTTNNRIGLRLSARTTTPFAQQLVVAGGVLNLNEGLGPSTSIDGINVKAAIAYQVGVGATGRDGTIANATSNPSLPTVTLLNIGQGPGAAYLNGWARSVRYYNTRLPNAQLTALTA